MARFALGIVVLLALVLCFLVPVASVGAASGPGISVAPQVGAPGTKFEMIGAGWSPGSVLVVTVEKGTTAGKPVEVTTDSAGRFRWMLDSNGWDEGTNYSATVALKTGLGTAATTRFAIAASQEERCFTAETGQCVRGRFLAYWQAHGGLSINGYPLSAEFGEVLDDGKPYVVQYFERTRFEYHPESADQEFQVLLGQFGRRVRPADPPADPNSIQTWFPQTGHNVPADFNAYWIANGGLTQFGLPISEAFQQKLDDGKTYRVQYFERARFESHPENPAPYDLLLGQFGRVVLGQVQR